jgi:aminopeptidase N
MSRALAVLAATTVLVGMPPATAVADDSVREPGEPGIGDPYFPRDGNGGYDVAHYDLDVQYDPATDVLTGAAAIDAVTTQNLSSFNLDFEGMTVGSISVDGQDATWTRDAGELTVTPRDPLQEGQQFTTVVRYDGVPETNAALGISGFMHTDDGAIVAGQPDVAATWFPSNDHPRDAASVSVSATVPEGLEALSNGVLRDHTTQDGWTTWSWEADAPMATYLVTLAIGEFDVRDYVADDIRYWDALDPDLFDPQTEGPSVGEVAEGSLARQPEIIDFLAGFFGPYPFDTAGGIVDDLPELQFALETQTRPVYAAAFFSDSLNGDLVVVHELAHQWAGDLLRLHEWQHIWLNEGFATYTEWLWLEREGLATPEGVFQNVAENAPPEFWETTIGDPGPGADELLDITVYYRGAMTLQALRQTVGDEVFFAIVKEWVSSQAGDPVTTDEFIEVAEKLSGKQLDDLFDTWLFTPEKPAGLPAPTG